METIVAVAVRLMVPQHLREEQFEGRRVYPDFLTVTAAPPARHPTILHAFHALDTMVAFGHPPDQGFITSTGRYVDREEALKIALTSGQPMIDHPGRHARELFSEDLW